MKDAAHHLKHVQRKMIQKARREERLQLNKYSDMSIDEQRDEEMRVTENAPEKRNPRLHNYPNYH